MVSRRQERIVALFGPGLLECFEGFLKLNNARIDHARCIDASVDVETRLPDETLPLTLQFSYGRVHQSCGDVDIGPHGWGSAEDAIRPYCLPAARSIVVPLQNLEEPTVSLWPSAYALGSRDLIQAMERVELHSGAVGIVYVRGVIARECLLFCDPAENVDRDLLIGGTHISHHGIAMGDERDRLCPGLDRCVD